MADNAGEGARARQLEGQRQTMMEEIKKQKEQISKEKTVKVGADKFVAQNDWVDSELKRQTVGLVKLQDFQRIRSTLEEKQRLEQTDLDALAAASPAAVAAKAKKDKKKATAAANNKRKDKAVLSFDMDPDEDESGNGASEWADAAPLVKKVKKNPNVDTSFLPDKEREELERQERAKLEREWIERQEVIKRDKISITYSFWDGSGHRKQVECRKGDTIRQFLEKCRQQIPQLRNVNVDNLMYIKEDLIIPTHYTFYDFIVNKSRGKSGPLFSFDVRDDVRLINDATVETEDSHAGKVMERVWYENNKHIFPANRWEVFDPEKDYGKYSIKDGN
ncbi:XAP5, circadian clock regulator-domain-containing protein [Entophlyctis helioformis]|nr:XAP5, circadian clock regulator-domain-containing protein [Entophlyctis helioformis]